MEPGLAATLTFNRKRPGKLFARAFFHLWASDNRLRFNRSLEDQLEHRVDGVESMFTWLAEA